MSGPGDAPAGRRRPTGPTRRAVVRGVERELDLAGIESPRVEAERLVASALDLDRASLGSEGSAAVEPSQAARIAGAVARRLEGEPLQHVEGEAAFRRIELVSDRRALIPRPETEQLLDLVEAWAARRGRAARALDVGTGSGAVALSLLAEGIAERVLGLDISPEALEQAGENAARTRLEGLELRRCDHDIWSALEPGETFDLVVSNPPYVTTGEWADLDPVVRDHEPRVALDGGPDGLDVLRAVIAGAPAALTPGGGLFLEIGSEQGARVKELLASTAGLTEVAIEADLAGRPRFATAVRGVS